MNGERLILIVDDDPHIREVVRFALRGAGYRTEEAGDGRAALVLFEERRPDLIVLDIMMPELDGIEVCRSLRSRSTVPIVFLSSRDEEVDRILGLELGGDDYVTKLFSPRELVARVKAVLRRGVDSEINVSLQQPATIKLRAAPDVSAAMSPETLESIISALLDNAQQHGGPVVNVSIGASVVPIDGAERLELTVEDDGPGISEANARQVFAPFFTTAGDRGGSGLGLAIADALVKVHGGTLTLDPMETGTRFRIMLPLP